MAYLAFYRTFRPSTFDEVVRQEHIVRILKNQISTGKIGHAYLFCGPRGTGKTTLAKIFARSINCLNPVNFSPCGKCPACLALKQGGNLDIMEIDAASNNGVDEMRDLREMVQYPPVAGKYKVYIIDEVHMLTASAFNALLKTLEEPPRHAVFILATTEPQKIPATILSRCMRFDFKLLPQKDLEELVKSVLGKVDKAYEDEAVTAIVRAGAGSARDCLSIADMCASYSEGKLTYADVNAVLGSADFYRIADICSKILDENADGSLSSAEEILSTGKSVGVLLKDMLTFFNNCAIVKVCKGAREIVNLPDETYARLEEAAGRGDGHKILRVTEILAKAENDLRYSTNGRITLETAILKCSMPETDYNIDAILGRLDKLEKMLADGARAPQKQIQPAQITRSEPPVQPTQTVRPAPKTPLAEETAREQEVGKPERKIIADDENCANPFERPPEIAQKPVTEPVQPTVWENNAEALSSPPKAGALGEEEKRGIFGKFIRSLRTVRKNAVLFTLCMDLESRFEGEKFVLTTDSDTVFKALNRAENNKFISEVLAELGVAEFEIRLKGRSESEYEKALGELKSNFGGIDIDIK